MGNKIIVGVHGIGDQVRYETIQAIAYQFCRRYKIPTDVPLGSFHSSNPSQDGIVEMDSSEGKLYFTEAYWADIARKPEKDGYTLEETKHWAKTIVERFRTRVHEYKNTANIKARENIFSRTVTGIRGNIDKGASLIAEYDAEDLYIKGKHWGVNTVRVDYRMIKSVLYEMIDAVNVMEKLLYLADKAGLFKFRLNEVLNSHLGDVQIFTEFEKHRREILDTFQSTVKKAYERDNKAEIYIVAHSEGTVVSFLGLLDAMKRKEAWVRNVRGLMTIGSPIDKHLLLWPGLWEEFSFDQGDFTGEKVRWINYYDKGDPVGFELNTAREWLKKKNCHAFQFEEGDDHGFYRYYMPGEAHIEYWKDRKVFDHFIGTVVDGAEVKTPQTRPVAFLTSFTLPYVAVSALIALAVYFLYKPVSEVISPAYDAGVKEMMWNVVGIAAILGGITVMARIPRLTKRRLAYLGSFIVFGLSALAYQKMVGIRVLHDIGTPILACPVMNALVSIAHLISPVDRYVLAVWVTASMVGLSVALLSGMFSTLRTRPLIVVGGTTVLGIVFFMLRNANVQSSFWPVLTGGALFLYLWWMAILLFDLTVIWHLYICRSKALTRLREIHIS